MIFRSVTKIIYTFKCMWIVEFKDGRESIVEERLIRSECGYVQFKENVKNWDRVGQAMKGMESISPIKSYDYWISQSQDEYNKKVTYQRVEELEYVGFD